MKRKGTIQGKKLRRKGDRHVEMITMSRQEAVMTIQSLAGQIIAGSPNCGDRYETFLDDGTDFSIAVEARRSDFDLEAEAEKLLATIEGFQAAKGLRDALLASIRLSLSAIIRRATVF